MTILTALTTLYDSMAQAGEAPRLGYTNEKIGYAIVLDADGRVLRFDSEMVSDETGRKKLPKLLSVPAAFKRSVNIRPNRMWDKSAYVLGVTAVEDKNGIIVAGQAKRTLKEHLAFKKTNIELLKNADDPGLRALRQFLEHWRPEMFTEHNYPVEALDQNIIFRLVNENETSRYIHERPAAVKLISEMAADGQESLCLVSGRRAPIARTHRAIKGVAGAQSSGASIVSFNKTAYESWGKVQGNNAPVSKDAADAYTAALNTLSAQGSGRKLFIGGTTVVFWAETPVRATGRGIENLMMQSLAGEDEDAAQTSCVRSLKQWPKAGRARDSNSILKLESTSSGWRPMQPGCLCASGTLVRSTTSPVTSCASGMICGSSRHPGNGRRQLRPCSMKRQCNAKRKTSRNV